MTALHFSRRTVDIAEALTAGGFAAGVLLLSIITAATLVYAWLIA
jgi:hypothetical protein